MTAAIAGDLAAHVHRRAVRLWLVAVVAPVLAMVLVGGATCPTESGLSITEWQPIMGALPPPNEAQIPQYRDLNAGMSLDAFERIR
jgi:heme a synthase